MKTSQMLLSTLKETPSDAEVVSHRLMLRAGMIRQVAAGIYTWLPIGLRVLRKVEKIVREEMDRIDAQEMCMPSVQPSELWIQSKRWEQYGPELLRFQDRHQRYFCLGPTHEEVITSLARSEIRSYRQLPMIFYQIQTKFRDEIRPRFGVMRGREFVMKDAYSFHLNTESLEKTYQDVFGAYCAIFNRLGLDYRAVEADSGSIGGDKSHEFHVLANSGEDEIVFSDGGDYAANRELAPAPSVDFNHELKWGEEMTLVDTPNCKTISALVSQFAVPIEKTIKTLVVRATKGEHGMLALIVRGDHTLSAVKAQSQEGVATPLEMVSEKEIREAIGAGPGSLGPVNLNIPCIVDCSVAQITDFVSGANIEGKHYFSVNWRRDVQLPQIGDIRNVEAGDKSPSDEGVLKIVRGIEVGHIFQLGTKYSKAMGAEVSGPAGDSSSMLMGCYGIGVTRVVAAAIEQNHDEKGIVWPEAIAPFQVCVVAIGYRRDERVRSYSDDLYKNLSSEGVEVLLDDRDERAGVMFSDMDLIGVPHLVVVGARALAEGEVEYVHRKTKTRERAPSAEINSWLLKKCRGY